MTVCCIIPAFQESRTIKEVVTLSQKFCTCVIVIDDGSTDNTGQIAEQYGAKVLRHSRNIGKGAALRTGFNYALDTDCEIIITLDGDLQHNPRSIPRFIQKIEEGFDVVVGSRSSTQSEEMPFMRKLSNLITTQALRVFFRVPVTDSQSGYRAFKRRVLAVLQVRDDSH